MSGFIANSLTSLVTIEMGCLALLPWLPLSRTQLVGLSWFVIWFWKGKNKKSQKLPAWVYAALSGDLACMVLIFCGAAPELARWGVSCPWAAWHSPLCVSNLSSIPGGTDCTAGLCPGCGGAQLLEGVAGERRPDLAGDPGRLRASGRQQRQSGLERPVLWEVRH